MLIATFTSASDLAGRTITHKDNQFMIDEGSPISPGEIMKHDAQGHLAWEVEGSRAWVGSLAGVTGATRDAALESDAAKKLALAQSQFAEGRPGKALDSLEYVVPGAAGDPLLARGLFDLASQIRATHHARFDDHCDELIERAQRALTEHAQTNNGAVCVGPARYLGGHSDLGPVREGWLWLSREHIGLQEFWVSESSANTALPMSSIRKIGLDGGQVAVSRVLPVVAFGILGLAAKSAKDRTFLMAYTDEECAVYEVDSKSPAEVRVAIAPVLRAAGVPLDEGSPPERAASPGDEDLVAKLARLADLHERGQLTDEEFTAFKAKLMREAE